MSRIVSNLLLAIAALVAIGLVTDLAHAQEFPLKHTFDTSSEKWANYSPLDDKNISEWTKDCGRGGGGGIHMKGSEGDENLTRIWKKNIPNPPRGKTVTFSVWAKGKDVQNVVVLCVRAYGADPYSFSDFVTTQLDSPLKGDFEWTQIKTELGVPADTKSLQVMLVLVGNGEAWFDDFAAEAGGDATFIAPGIFEARGQFNVLSQSKDDAVLLMPMPLSYLQQAPLSYELSADPPDRVKSIRVYEDKVAPGNWIAELTIQRAAAPAEATSKPIQISWVSQVLIGPSSFTDVPKTAAMPAEWPAEARPWLASTKYVQAADERIKAIAAEIRTNNTDVMTIIDGTLKRAHDIYERQAGQSMKLDAVSALDHVGSCTSCANLVAALLRACGVPARILAGYPAWSGPLQTHYIVEAYIPTYGWYPIESTMLRQPWDRHQQVQVSIVPPQYEDRSGGRPGIASGVPFLSLTEQGENSALFLTVGTISKAKPGCDHEAKPLRNFPAEASAADWNALLASARTKWAAWLATGPAAGERGSVRFGPAKDQLVSVEMKALLEQLAK